MTVRSECSGFTIPSFARVRVSACACVIGLLLALFSPAPQALAYIANGANAIDLIGQYDDSLSNPVPDYTKGAFTTNNYLNRLGLGSQPGAVELDSRNHRLYIGDGPRVLVYNLNSSDQLIDRIPDYVLGKPDFSSTTASTSAYGIGNVPVDGLAYSSGSNLLYVSDSSYARVLVFDVTTITNGEPAIRVLGKPRFGVTANIQSASSTGSPYGLALDDQNDRLFVADSGYARILVFDVSSVENGEDAVAVLGQSNFIGGSCSATQAGMCAPRAVEYDPDTSLLYVSDSTYNRVTVYDVATITNGENAAYVLGQANFTTTSCSISQTSACTSYGVTLDRAGNRLFVSQNSHNRVTVFDITAISNGEAAQNVLGQSTYSTSTSIVSITSTPAPYGMAFDPGNQYLYISNNTADRVGIFDVTSISDNEPMVDLLGQYDDNLAAPSPRWNKSGSADGPNKLGINSPFAPAVDTVNNRVFVADTSNNRVLVYTLNTNGSLVDHIPDYVLGQADFATGAALTTQSGFQSPAGVSADPAQGLVYVADAGNNRVMVFSGALTNGMNAWRVLGQPDFTSRASGLTQSTFKTPYTVNASGSLVFVADYSNNRVMVFSGALTNGMNAWRVLGQANFTSSSQATSATGMRNPAGVDFDDDNQRLFVADSSNNRVLVHSTAALSNGQSASNVLGQSLFTTSTSGRTRTTLSTPFSASYDSANNRLFVADLFNGRVVTFDVATVTDGEPATHVLGKKNFTQDIGNEVSQDEVYYYTYGTDLDTNNQRLYVSDYYASRILVFDTTPSSSTALIKGTVYDSNGTTPLTSKLVTVAVNGTNAGSGTTSGAGGYSISIPVYQSGGIVTAYLDNETENGVAVTRGTGGSVSNLDIRRDWLTIHSHSGALTNYDIGLLDDNGDTDITNEIVSTTAFGTNIMQNTSLRIASGATALFYSLVGTDVVLEGTMASQTNVTLTGSLLVNRGTLLGNENSSTFRVTGTSSFLGGRFVPGNMTALFYGGLSLSGATVEGGDNGTIRVGPEPGLYGTFFNSTNFSSYTSAFVDPAIYFYPDDAISIGTNRASGNTTYTARWVGQVRADYNETYTFYAITDDGARMWVDGTLVINSWFDQGSTERSGSIALTPGWHNILFEHYNNGGAGAISLSYSSSSEAKKIIPSTNLRNCGTKTCGTSVDAIHYTQTGGTVKNFAGTLQVRGSGGNLILSRGTFAATGGTLRVKGDLINNGSFTHSGTVLLEPNAPRALETGTGIFTNVHLNDGLTGYWKFDERNGYTVQMKDSSGNGNNATIVNAPTISSDIAPTSFPNSGSLVLDGSTQYATVSDGFATNETGLRSTDVTIALWVKKLSHTNYGTYVSKNVSGDGDTGTSWWQLLNYSTTGRFAFRVTQDSDSLVSSSAAAVGLNDWHHVAVTYNGTQAKIYIDGKLDNSTALAVTPAHWTTTMYIGRRSDGYYANSQIDDLRMYNRALTEMEIAALAGRGTSTPGTGTGTVTLSGALNVRADVLFDTGTLDAGSQNAAVSLSGSWVNRGGIFSPRGGTVTLRGTGSRIVYNPGQRFANLNLSGGTVTAEVPLSASGTLTVRGSTVFNMSGAVTVRAGSLRQLGGTMQSRSGTIIISNAVSGSLLLSNTGYNLRIEDATERGLTGYWKFDEGQRTVRDWSGNGKDGTMQSGTVWSGSLVAPTQFTNLYSGHFDGSDDWVVVNSPSLPTGDFTYSAWVRLSSTSDEAIISARDGVSSDEFLIYISTLMYTYINNTLRATSAQSIPSNTWTHVAVSREGSTVTQYINGSVDGTGSDGTALSFSTCPLLIGTEADSSCIGSLGNYTEGMIDDVRVYNRALKSWEVNNLAKGRYARGGSGTAVTTLLAPLNLSGSLSIDAGTLATNAFAVSTKGNLHANGGSFSGSTANLTVNGNVFIATGATIIAPTGWFRVNGNWENESGSLLPRTGTVTLIGVNQYLSGSTTFANLTKIVTSADTLQFEAGKTQYVTGNLTLSGSSAVNVLSLRSSQTGVRWFINPTGIRNVSYLSVKDSRNTDPTLIACTDNCVNSGNNSGWNFGYVIAIYGTVYNDAGITNIGANKTVAVSVNGNAADSTAETTSTGSYYLGGLTYGPDDVLALYLDNETENAVTVSVGTNNNFSGADLWRDHVIVRCDNACQTSSTILNTANDNGDADITDLLTNSGNILSLYKLVVPSGQTFRPTARVNITDDVSVEGTLKMPIDPFVVGGDFTMSGGAITHSGTLILKGASSKILETEGRTLKNLVITNGLVSYWKFDETPSSPSAAADASGYGHSGTYVNSPSSSTTVAPARFGNARSIDFNGTTQYLYVPNAETPTGDFTFAAWIRPDIVTDEMIAMQADGSGGDEFYWYINGSNKLVTATNNATRATSSASIPPAMWTHVAVTRSGSTITQYINGVSDSTGSDGTAMNFSTCHFLIGVDVDSGCIASLGNYYDGKIDDFRVYDYALTAVDIAGLAAGNQPATGTGTVTLSGALFVSGDLRLNAGVLDVSSNDYGITLSGSWMNQGGTFAPRHGTVTLDGNTSSSRFIQGGGQRFNNLTLASDAGPGAGATWRQNDRLNLSGALTLSSGTLDASQSGTFAIRTKTMSVTSGIYTRRNGTIILSNDANASLSLPTRVSRLRIEDPTESGLVGYWKMDDGQQHVRDWSGRENHGTVLGGAIWTGATLPGITFDNPHAMRFDGTNDYIDLGAASVFDPSQITVAAWILPNWDGVYDYVISKEESGSPFGGYILRKENSDFEFVIGVGSTEYSTTWTSNVPTALTWSHVAGTYDGETARLYVNGSLVASNTSPSGSLRQTTAGTRLLIGESHGWPGRYFKGSMDDVRIYNRALSDNEVRALADGRYASMTGSGASSVTLTAPLLASGAFMLDSGSFNAAGYPVVVQGSGSVYAGTYQTNTAYSVFSGGLVSAGDFISSSATIDVNGGLTILTGSFLAPRNANITVAGNWLRQAGTFKNNSGTVIFDGADQTVSGSTTFGNLRKSVSVERTLTFAAGTTQTITGSMLLQGAAGQRLFLRSSTSGVQAKINPQGSRSVQYLNIKDNNNTNVTSISCLTSCIDSGNNTNWDFGTAITGKLFTDEGFSPFASQTVALSVNGAAASSTDTTDSNGSFSLAVASYPAGSVLTTYLDGASVDLKTVTVTIGTGGSLSGVNLYRNRLIVRSDSGSYPFTNTHLATADDNGDTDITQLYKVYSTGSVVNSGYELLVWTGALFTPGGNVTAGSIDVRGTMTMSGYTTRTLSAFDIKPGGRLISSGTVLMSTDGNGPGISAPFIATAGSPVRNLAISDGLVGYWTMDDFPSSVTAADSSGFGRHGTLSGGTTLTTSNLPSTIRFRNRSAATFDGTNDSMHFEHIPISRPFTFATWWYGTGLNGSYRDLISPSEDYGPHIDNSNVLMWYDAGENNANTALQLGRWYHLATTIDASGNLTHYVNGIADGTHVNEGAKMKEWNRIGYYNEPSASILDDVRLYNRALSALEIASLAAGTGPASSNTTVSLSGAVAVSGDLTLGGGILDATSSNYRITVSGSWLNHGGILSSRSGSVVLDGSGHLLSGGTDAGRFNDLTIDGTGGGKRIMDDRLSASGTVTIASGTFDMGSGASIRAQSILQTGGTFVSRSGSVILDGDKNGSVGITDPIGGLSLESGKADDLVAHWTFNEGQRRAYDRSDHGYHATVNGAVWSGASVASRLQYENISAMQFDGTDDYLLTPNLRNSFPDESLTISVWFYPTNGGVILSELGTAAINASWHDSIIEVLSNGTTYVRVYNLTSINVGTATMNAWNHVVLRYRDGADLVDGFLNGTQSTQSTGNRSSPWESGYGLYYGIGALDSTSLGDGTYFNGMMDDIRIYNRALTNEEVRRLYRGGFGAGASGATVWKQTSDLDINGNLRIIGGTLDASTAHCSGASCDIALRGNLYNTAGSGALIGRTGTVTLDGTVQTLTGSTTFAGLAKTTASGTLFLDPNAIFTVTGSLQLQGATNQLMKIRASAGSGVSYPLGQAALRSPTNSTSDYNMGYRFTPRTDGYITALGARCTAATRTVRLYTCDNAECSTGTEQRSATVYTGNLHEWGYTKISPYPVSAGSSYVVSVRGNPWCYSNTQLPIESGGVSIEDTRYIAASNNMPTSTNTGIMYGQADVEFMGKEPELALVDGGSQTIDHLNVAHNDATAGSSLHCSSSAEGCVDGGNAFNWLFGDVRITGRVFEYNRVTPASGKRVTVSINGGASAGIGYSDAGGMYDINGISNYTGGSVLAIYLDNNASYYGSMVLLGSGSSMTGADLYRYWLVARSESGNTVMTNQHFRYADNGDSDMTSTLVFSGSPYNLYTSDFLVWSGTTVRLEGGGLYTGYAGGIGNLHLDGSLNANDNIVVAGNIYSQSGGTFTSGTGLISLLDDYRQDGGTFIAPEANTLVLGDDFFHSGGAFLANSGTVFFNNSAGATVQGSGVTFNNLIGNHSQYGIYDYWPFDDLSGSRAQDVSGYANSGNLIGATFSSRAAPTRWDNKGSLSFDGNDYMLVADSSTTDPFYMTISIWVRVTGGNATYRHIVCKPSSAVWSTPWAYYCLRLNSSNQIEAWFNTPSGSNLLTSSTTISVDSKWHHIAYKVVNGSQGLYLDGQQVASASVAGSITNSAQPLAVGTRNTADPGEYFTGDIDDLRIYYYNLSDSEIRALASGGQPSGTYSTTFSGSRVGISGDATFHTPVALGNRNTVLVVSGSWINNGGIFESASGTVIFNGSGGIRTGGPEGAFNNVVISGTGNGKRVLRDNLLLSGALTINSGTLNFGNERSIHTRILRQSGGAIEGSGSIVFDQHGAMSGSVIIGTTGDVHLEDPVSSALEAYWKFDERGGSALDSSGKGRTVTLNNGAQWSGSTIAPVGFDNVAALKVDGTNDYASIGTFGSFGNVTISAWIYRTGATASRESIISYKESGNCGFLLNLNENGSSQYPTFYLNVGGSWAAITQSTAVSTNTWTHLAGTYDGTTQKLYRDGQLVASTTRGGNMAQCSANTGIGSRNSYDQQWFPGLIDDMRIYSRALSDQEIRALAIGEYPLGWSGSTTMRLGSGPFNVSGALKLYNGSLDTSAATPVMENRLILNQNNGRYIGGSGLQTFHGGVSLSGATVTAGAGTIDINGILNLSGATLNRGTGQIRASGYTRIGRGSTLGKGSGDAALVIDSTTTLENEMNYAANLGHIRIGSSPDTVTLSGNLLVEKLTVGTGDTLVANGYDMVVGTGGLYLHGTLDTQVAGGRSTTLTLSGSWIASGTGDLISGSSAVILAGKGNSQTLTASGTFRRLVLDNGLVGYWRFDEFGGTIAKDSSRFANTGTFNGPLTWSGSSVGGAAPVAFFNQSGLLFNGSSTYVEATSNASLQNSAFTYVAWIKPSGSGIRTIIGWSATSGGPQFRLESSNALGLIKQEVTNIGSSSSNVTNNAWNHVAVSYDSAGRYHFYLNGVPAGNGTNAQSFTFSNLWIGARPSVERFSGIIDDIRIYSRILSASEIAALASGSPSTGSGVYTMGSPLSVSGSFVNTTATLNNSAGSYPIHLTGSWMNTGDYTAGTSTVYFSDRQSQTMSGNTVFHNLVARTNGANRTIFFDHSGRQSMSGSLVLQGVGGNTLSIRSTRSGSGAHILLDGDAGSQTIDHLNVQDSDASGGATLICSTIAESCTDSGNNTNWSFDEPAASGRARDTFFFLDF